MMPFFLWLCCFIILQPAVASTITVTNVKISIDVDTPAAAREKAIVEAHRAAFRKMIGETYCYEHIALPPDNILSDMVTSFSIDKEQSLSGNYTVFFTFHFEEPQIKAWLDKQGTVTHVLQKPFKATAFYTTLEEWQRIKKALEQNNTAIRLISLSTHAAYFDVIPVEDIDFLKKRLEKEGFDSVIKGETWEICPSSSTTLKP